MTLEELQLLTMDFESTCGQLQLMLDAGGDIKTELPVLIALPEKKDLGKIGTYIKLEIEHVNREFISRYKYGVRWCLYAISNNFSTNDPTSEQVRCISGGYSTTYINESNIKTIVRGITLKIRDIAVYGIKQIDGSLPGINGRSIDMMDYTTPLWKHASLTLNEQW